MSASREHHIDRRNWKRVPFAGKATITRTGKTVEETEINNLSLHDIFVKTSADIPLYELVGLRLILGNSSPDLGIDLRGIVVRRDATGLAIRLIGLDFDSFKLLKKVIAYTAEDKAATIKGFLDRLKTTEFPGPQRYRLITTGDGKQPSAASGPVRPDGCEETPAPSGREEPAK
jgi:hypothetical protein